MAVVDRYIDHTPLTEEQFLRYRDSRRARAVEDLRLMLVPETRYPFHIVEVGSGIGGVTAALRELFSDPDTKITSIDADPSEWVRRSAREHSTAHFEEDLLLLTAEELQSRIQGADLIVALRTSGKVARYLLQTLGQTDFVGQLVFSLIAETDTDSMREIARIQRILGGQNFGLIERRGLTERGYTFSFPLVQKEQVT